MGYPATPTGYPAVIAWGLVAVSSGWEKRGAYLHEFARVTEVVCELVSLGGLLLVQSDAVNAGGLRSVLASANCSRVGGSPVMLGRGGGAPIL